MTDVQLTAQINTSAYIDNFIKKIQMCVNV